MEVKFVKPTTELIKAIADDMRAADAAEVWASHHHTPFDALMRSWEVSDRSVIVTVSDEPCVMLGLVIHGILSETGSPWLLGTENALKYKRHFLIQVPEIIDEMLTICPKLINYVHAENTVSIKWLKWIGFTLDEPLPYGCDNALFHKFYLERS